ncbi:signal transduction histidine kinase [Parabacteroides sp. PF5-5]|uniref:sensor histidine kinase n=1 Tax=unclassified Parabacteroides TaxID=2649774 RepID=UPI0024745088|nr:MULTISPECIES: HAMP domain-containing sensor histidine kinase [unclassified Parabacteroides]MDH6303788.1 signal transduction histidine kinase [Parabacteroides sp. PH5-39]MDH6314405.1 signal transduction histidine kinase [Parabacteroides sp. PF5-13]MDH6318530.1 signal transduction histidine kinase [Parabacteroides sp. PH5-13]MDH6322177.1 signal transduction histidine kinase [Parabacteroides sp. PH5-8]MDH6325743.1 signal transduction histidine kinase [Parabacteroides sp. PH5-41]
METKLRVKLIAFLIVLAVATVVGWQAYWLKGLYNSLWEKTEANIRDAMRMADYQELFLRVEQLKKARNDSLPGWIELDLNHEDKENKLNVSDNAQLDSLNYLLSYLQIISELEERLQKKMHSTVDDVLPIRYSVYDSILTTELKNREIFTPHALRIYQLRDSSIPFAYMQFDSTKTFGIHEKEYFFDYPVAGREDQVYRLYIDYPERIVLRQMGGILLSSGLLLFFIIIAFAYLLRTIFKQKTVEELKTDFTNNVTHELKTPIAVAFAANDVLLNHSEKPSAKQERYLTIIREQLSRLSGMVEQILTLSVENRATFRLNPESIRVGDLFPSLMEQHTLKTEKDVRFTVDIPDGLTLTADRAHLYNILSNLIENAIKYTATEIVSITVCASENNYYTLLSVADKGIGISETNQKRVFDKFFRVPQGNLHDVKGYGLGLFYIKDIMEKHNGYVTVSSQPGKGSTFTLHFKKG